MPVSLRKSRTTPVCSSPSPLGRFARPLHEHDATVHPPSINIRSQVISTGNVLASPLNDTISVFGKQSGLAFVRLPSVPDMINAFNSSSNAVSQQVSSAYQALCKEWDVPQDYRPKEVNPTGARLTRAHGTATENAAAAGNPLLPRALALWRARRRGGAAMAVADGGGG
eukprot:CAMPEP_0172162888 /NCGR_PEP_ID=MMETSP1050-20130122/6951_1 /TAXON_ID=233186 /ORGANISM="Cryptomonas curvata, Strain CCAP979/52" /LENGTH=168 /DNA_ID=CAMNT_0012832987 /DNA_START=216 /DNA_END=720 /DNA_ORIENTATION=+